MCSRTVAKWGLMIFNIIFLLIGVVSLGLGIFALVNTNDSYYTYLTRFSSDLSAIDTPSLFKTAAIVLIVVGGAVLFIAIMGFCGACKEIKSCLYGYAMVVIVILVLEVAAVVLAFFFRSDVDSYATNWLKSILNTYYYGPYDTSSVYSLAWDYMMLSLKCCGATGGANFAVATKWNTTYINNGASYTASIPLTCCKFSDTSKFPSDISAFLNSMVNDTCPYTEAESHSSMGCYKKLINKVMQYNTIVLAVGITVAVIELFAVVFAFAMACNSENESARVAKMV